MFSGPVIGFAVFQRLDAVELFHQDDEGEFVLHGQRAERPDGVGFLAGSVVMSVSTAD